jgi:hypothetical protein
MSAIGSKVIVKEMVFGPIKKEIATMDNGSKEEDRAMGSILLRVRYLLCRKTLLR